MKKTLNQIIEHKNLLFFVGGAVTALAAKKIIESDKVKNFAVKTAAKVMQFQDEANETLLNIKEDAEDIKNDAIDAKKKTIQNK
ncbi:MAG: hypothetical protein LBT66_07155 [Methanobrevibacter sp.]|nr:hypothetical protein [Candidatus Methanovirga meridionalis]